MRKDEHNEQVTLMQWWSLACYGLGVPESCLWAIPNGGFRQLSVAKALKAEGVRAGVPDLFLAFPTPLHSGLFIEMKKTKGGRVSDNQKTMLAMLSEVGYAAHVCHGWEEARNTIVSYLDERKSKKE